MKNIDNLFKEELGSYTEAPPPPVWAALEKRLDNDRKRRAFPFRWLWYFSILSFIVLLGASFAWNAQKGNTAVTAITTPIPDNNVTKQSAIPVQAAATVPVATAGKSHTNHIHTRATTATGAGNRVHKKTISTVGVINAESQEPAPKNTNNNPGADDLYGYEEENENKNNVPAYTPARPEVQGGYVINTIRKHNLVASDMTPVAMSKGTQGAEAVPTAEGEDEVALTTEHNTAAAVEEVQLKTRTDKTMHKKAVTKPIRSNTALAHKAPHNDNNARATLLPNMTARKHGPGNSGAGSNNITQTVAYKAVVKHVVRPGKKTHPKTAGAMDDPQEKQITSAIARVRPAVAKPARRKYIPVQKTIAEDKIENKTLAVQADAIAPKNKKQRINNETSHRQQTQSPRKITDMPLAALPAVAQTKHAQGNAKAKPARVMDGGVTKTDEQIVKGAKVRLIHPAPPVSGSVASGSLQRTADAAVRKNNSTLVKQSQHSDEQVSTVLADNLSDKKKYSKVKKTVVTTNNLRNESVAGNGNAVAKKRMRQGSNKTVAAIKKDRANAYVVPEAIDSSANEAKVAISMTAHGNKLKNKEQLQIAAASKVKAPLPAVHNATAATGSKGQHMINRPAVERKAPIATVRPGIIAGSTSVKVHKASIPSGKYTEAQAPDEHDKGISQTKISKVDVKRRDKSGAYIAATVPALTPASVDKAIGKPQKTAAPRQPAKNKIELSKVVAAAPATKRGKTIVKTRPAKRSSIVAAVPRAAAKPVFTGSDDPDDEPYIVIAPQASAKENEKIAAKDSVVAKKTMYKQDSAATAAVEDTGKAVFRRFVAGIKGGYETGLSIRAANKAVVSPYLEYRFNSRFSLMAQPAVKAAYISSHAIGNRSSYYNVNSGSGNYTFLDSSLVYLVFTGDSLWNRNYAYKETHDSIVKSYDVGGTYAEVELPLLLKYYITPKLSVYGGINAGYSKLVAVREHTYTSSPITATGNVSTLARIHQAAPDPSTGGTGLTYQGSPLSGYTGPAYPSQQGSIFRLGYMLGFSYEYRKRWLADVLVQQSQAKSYMQGGYNVNTALSLPYFRLTIGYRLTK